MANKRLELSGQTINQITVISPAGSSPKGAVLWLCRCNRCGKEFVIDGARLRGKNPRKDCGCSWRDRSADLSGQAFGGMDVLRRNGTGNNGDALYLCRCRLCGQEKTLPACTIRSKPKSCGCQAVSREKTCAGIQAWGGCQNRRRLQYLCCDADGAGRKQHHRAALGRRPDDKGTSVYQSPV